jgi:competence protein ComEC
VGVSRFALPVALAGVAAGILVADGGAAVPVGPLVATGAALAIFAIALGRGAAAVALLGLACVAAAGGAWRGGTTTSPAPERSVASLVDNNEHEVNGVVADDPRPRGDRLQLVLEDVVATHGGTAAALDDRLLVWLPRGIDARAGDRVQLSAEVELAEDFDGFAYRAYLARQGIGAIARARSASVQPGGSGLLGVVAGVRATLLGGLNDLVPEPEAALGAGILLGVRSSIAPEITAAFATAGLTHVVAISGWNIAIVSAIVLALVRPVGRARGGRWMTSAMAASIVGGYIVLTGASPSVVRAGLMAGAMLLARHGGSRAHAASALALAALVMLLAAPPVLWDVGFQLSLLATAGLVWFGASIERRLAALPGWLREPIALTLAAQLTTLPVILVNFERLSLVAPIANVLVVPFVPIAMLLSAVAAVAGVLTGLVHVPVLGDAVAWFAGGAAWLVLRVIVTLGTAVASIPGAAVPVSIPPVLAVAWFPLLALGSWALRAPDPDEPAAGLSPPGRGAALVARLVRPLPVVTALVAALLVISFLNRADGRLHLVALDVGQGDAILVETPVGRTVLVDGGPDPELTLRRLGAHLPFFARRIDLLVLTHPHQDHVAGLVDVLDRFRVGALLEAGIPFENAAYDRLLADASRTGVPVVLARSGDRIAIDPSTSLEVLYPSAEDASAPLPEDDINNGSVVMVLRSGGFSALLTGDAEAPVEGALIARGAIPPVDVLKVGHHGSRSSTSSALLEAAAPAVAMISVGAGNEYGHPAPETLAALAARGVTIERTDLDGDVEVEVEIDGHAYRVQTAAGWGPWRAVRRASTTASIAPCPCPTDRPPCACWRRPGCPTGSSPTHVAWLAWPSQRPVSWRRRRSRSTAGWSRPRRCSTTSTRRSAVADRTTGSPAPASSRRWDTVSSPCRSPPTRSPPCSTTIGTPSAGRRCSWPSPTATSRKPS